MTRLLGGADWLLLTFATASGVLQQALRPTTWRRAPVRAEFWRFMDMICLRNLAPMLITAAFVGLTLVSQALYWLEQFGQVDAISQVIVFVMVREIGPIIVGLIVLGTGGIVLMGELSGMHDSGELDALDRLGVDPFVLFVVPRVVALILAVFAHSVLFIIVAFAAGYAMAAIIGAINLPPLDFMANVLTAMGRIGYLILPAKAIAIGGTIGVVCAMTAMQRRPRSASREALTATGFMRAITGILLFSALLSLTL